MYQFEITGKPASYSKPRVTKTGTFDPKKKEKEFIQWQVRPYAPREPLSCFVEVSYVFFLPMPKDASKIKKQQMLDRIILPRRPDIDNLAYILTNAMSGIVYEDDCLVYKMSCEKYYGEDPKTIVKVIPKWDIS